MRVVSSATCTSGEPVSLAARAYSATTSDFLAAATVDICFSLKTDRRSRKNGRAVVTSVGSVVSSA